MHPRLAIVVPTFNRDEYLARCLSALSAQDLPAREFEIIVADNAGSQTTRDLVERHQRAAAPTLRYLRADLMPGPAAARNAGWRATTADVIAFTDDDCLPAPDWARAGLAAMNDEVHAVAGRVVMPLPPVPTDYERDAAGLTTGEFVTANCFCRRKALEAVGGFDQRFTEAWREDSDLQFTLLEHGFVIRHASDAVVVHPIRPARWGVSLKQQRKTMADALLFKKHPSLYRQRLPGFPADYYAIVSLLIVAGMATVAAWPGVAAVAAAGWAGLSFRFCRRRLRDTSRKFSHVAEMAVTSLLIPPLSTYWRLRGLVRHRTVF